MNDFAAIQTQDTINPNDAVYVDPMQWWYDLSQDEQDQYRAEEVAFLRHVCDVVGVPSVSSNSNWETKWNPKGINPAVWNEFKRIEREGEFVAGPV